MSHEEPVSMWGEHSMSMQEPGEMSMQAPPQAQMMQGGHLYIQANEIRNCVIHYYRAPDGTITEAVNRQGPGVPEGSRRWHLPDASLDEITSASIPYQSPQGLMGF